MKEFVWENTFLFIFTAVAIIVVVLVFADVFNVIEIGLVRDDITSEQRIMNNYVVFERECLSREFTREQCLIIWSKDN